MEQIDVLIENIRTRDTVAPFKKPDIERIMKIYAELYVKKYLELLGEHYPDIKNSGAVLPYIKLPEHF